MNCAAPALVFVALAALGCSIHASTPALQPRGPLGGYAPTGFHHEIACGNWRSAIGEPAGLGPDGEDAAESHVSFPERDPRSCFVPVHKDERGLRPGPVPPGCGYPAEQTMERIEREAQRYEKIARGDAASLPLELACSLPNSYLRAAARHNGEALRALARRAAEGEHFPYTAISAFGYGAPGHGASVLRERLPADACPPLDQDDLALLSVNISRAERAAEAYHAGVAPIVTVSGGAVHSPVVEAFALLALLECKLGVPREAVLLDPCADHTHTNMRNTGSLVVALGGRTAYIVTDEGLQSAYLEEWTLFNLLSGSLDQRALRDFGYIIGSFRRASVGDTSGFWFTPYRFWAEPRPGLGDFTCVR